MPSIDDPPNADAAPPLPSIWVDADACPKASREILIRIAQRCSNPIVFVANRPVQLPDLPNLSSIQVPPGMDIADNEIVRLCQAGDLVVSSDIPLAWEVIEKGGTVVSPRGMVYTEQNIKARLTMRDFMSTLRASGIETGGAPALSQKDTHAFANFIDRFLTKAARQRKG